MKTTREQIIEDIAAKVEAKLLKTDLANNEVKLSLIDDLKNSINKVTTFESDVKSMGLNAKKTNKLFQDAISQKEIILKNYSDNKNKQETILKELNLLFKTINTQAKDLGIDINSIPAYKEYLNARETLSKLYSENQSFWELVSKF
jgi:hypothetical protein